MTLDEMILQRQEQVVERLGSKCSDDVIHSVKCIIGYAMKQAHSKGKVDYANEDLPEILRNHPGPF